MENLIEIVLTEAVSEVGKGAIGRSFEEVEATKETEPGIITQS